jgi:Phage portal protein, SPP1 Gp6-like
MSSVETGPLTLPEQWRDNLLAGLAARQKDITTCDAYYSGEHKLLFATAKFREAFGLLFSAFSDNWCDLVVDASAERLRVDGFRFGDDEKGDQDAWDLWQRNGLDAESELAHTESIKLGCSYALVGPDDGGEPTIQIEAPTKAIVAVDPANGRQRLAGLRNWTDEWGTEHVVLYLPGEVVWWSRDGDRKSWEEGVGSGKNPIGVVPLVPLPNAPTLRERQGRSDIKRVIPLQDAVNKLCADMIVASEYAAFPQRWLTGVDIPVYPEGDPQAGQPLPSFTGRFKAGGGVVWAVEEMQAAFGSFPVSDLTIYVRAIEMLIQHIAAQTRTPPHYLLGAMGSFPSGESLKATETGLVAKVRRKQLAFGEGWEEAMRLAFMLAGDPRADDWDCETIWMNPESRQTAEVTDAAVKMSSIGVPRPALWEYIGFTPQQIERWIAQGADVVGPPVMARETIQASPGEAAAQLPGAPGAPQAPPAAAPTTATETTTKRGGP